MVETILSLILVSHSVIQNYLKEKKYIETLVNL